MRIVSITYHRCVTSMSLPIESCGKGASSTSVGPPCKLTADMCTNTFIRTHQPSFESLNEANVQYTSIPHGTF
jgi:hypothetical protein